MAIKSNDSNVEVAAGGVQLYSGLANFKVIAVNPTMDDLHELGIMGKKEPNYFVELRDEEFFKLTFWVKNADLTTRFEILMNSKERVSKSGKNQWLNAVGQATWSDGEPEYDWFKKEGLRKALSGEETLINFTKAWANVANGDEVSFDTIEKIVEGDPAEVKALLEPLASNGVRLLIGVKDGKYQTVYTKHFGRVKPQRDDIFAKNLNDEYGSFNCDFDTDLGWGTFVPPVNVVASDEEGEAESENSDWV